MVKAVMPLWVLLLGAPGLCAYAASAASVSGTVRNPEGVPQSGVLVELLSPNAAVVARVLTDADGHYRIFARVPGHYDLRVSASRWLASVRPDVRLEANLHTVADLTLTSLLGAGGLLPVEQRPKNEPSDDWRWTLRSAANRPLLHLLPGTDAEDGASVSSSREGRPHTVAQGQISLVAGDGSFGEGGTHQVIALDRAGVDGDVSLLRANLGDNAASPSGGSVSVAVGLQRERAGGGDTRIFVSFDSHPEVQTAEQSGLQLLRSAVTQRVAMGDMLEVDAGTLTTAEHLLGTRINSAPYLRIAVRPSQNIAVEYHMATDRALQSAQGLDEMFLPQEALADTQSRPLLVKGLHQEVALIRSTEQETFTLAMYRDSLPLDSVQGSGPLRQASLVDLPVIADPVTGIVRFALPGYAGQGVRMVVDHHFSPAVAAVVEAEAGPALRLQTVPASLASLPQGVRARATGALIGTLRMTAKRTGTTVDVHYRWQPANTLTPVDEYDAAFSSSYLGFRVKQKLWAGKRVKQINGVVQGSNLLAEGYQAVPASDSQPFYLAQTPRAIQGGLAFSF